MIGELLTWDFRGDLQDYVAWTIAIVAFVWGGGPERATAAVWVVLFELVPNGYNLIDDAGHFGDNIDIVFATTDSVAGACWVAIALYANRNYTLWIAAMQLLAVLAHLASGIAEPISPAGYAVMAVAPSWIQLILLALGLARHIHRKRKHGDYRDWRRGTFLSRFDARLYDKSFAAIAEQGTANWREEFK